MQPKRKASEKEQPNTKKIRFLSKLIFQKKLAKQPAHAGKKRNSKEIQSAKRSANLAAGLMKKKDETMVSVFIFLNNLEKETNGTGKCRKR